MIVNNDRNVSVSLDSCVLLNRTKPVVSLVSTRHARKIGTIVCQMKDYNIKKITYFYHLVVHRDNDKLRSRRGRELLPIL